MAAKKKSKPKAKAKTVAKKPAKKAAKKAAPKRKAVAKKVLPVEIVAVLDRSSSMSGMRVEAVAGFNKFLAEQQKLPGEANLTLILFSDEVETLFTSKPLKNVKPLTDSDYVTDGMTALNDALGGALLALEVSKPKRAIISVLTDGQENASKEVSAEKLKALITAAEKRGWEIVYLAANQDAFAVGAQLGIVRGRRETFAANGQGLLSGYATASFATSNYRAGQA